MSAGEKVTLKMINGERYACPAIGDDVILKGQKITVSEEHANMLLADSYTDASNNEHFYFEQVDGDAADDAGSDDGEGEDAAPKKVARKARTKAAAK